MERERPVDDVRAPATEAEQLARAADESEERVVDLALEVRELRGSLGWRIVERLDRVRERVERTAPGRQATAILRRSTQVLLDEGWAGVWARSGHKLSLALRGQHFLVKPPPPVPLDVEAQYLRWLEREVSSAAARASQPVAWSPGGPPLLSLVGVPALADEGLVCAGLDSLRAQSYPHWELLLVTDDALDGAIRRLVEATGDPRIRVQRRDADPAPGLAAIAGAYVGFYDVGDELAPHALLEVATRLDAAGDIDLLYSDEDRITRRGRRLEPFFKPGWSPDLLLSTNYIGRLAVARRSIVERAGGLRFGLDGNEDHDLWLRVAECATRIEHLPRMLYHRRRTWATAIAARKRAAEASGRLLLGDALRRRGREAEVEVMPTAPARRPCYAVRYAVGASPLVSILIPTRDKWKLLDQCLTSIDAKTPGVRYEIVVVDNDSDEAESLAYLERLGARHKVIRAPGAFNYARINNMAAAAARGDYLLFLNNDVEVLRPDWLTAMLEHAQHPEVGAVGAKLLYPDGRIQHAGVVTGTGGVAGHVYRYAPGAEPGNTRLVDLIRNCSAVTAACMLVPRRVFEKVGGFDERLRVVFNDVDLCLRIRQYGYLIVYTPFALLVHYESATRRQLHPRKDEQLFRRQWRDVLEGDDPYYNPNLTRIRDDGTLEV